MEEAIEGRKRQKGKGKPEDGEDSKDSEESGGTSIFHGKQLRDYQGRSYVDPPTELKNVPHDAYRQICCCSIQMKIIYSKWL